MRRAGLARRQPADDPARRSAPAPDAAPGNEHCLAGLQHRQAAAGQPEVRHALALAINNQRLMQSIYYGTAETAASMLPRASWAYDNDA
ncbi:ABC transporter substrate-binding protein [Klebsiella variicola subsp. variicola]|nr:ABC transporter substrate-binding protein [Klebsiella variicola subsp. variicola]